MSRSLLRHVLLASFAFALVSAAGCDPVGDDAIAALGPEVPGVRRGPLHRPGQPCLVCHDGAIGDPPAFTVAGTVYETPVSPVGLKGATITMTDSTKSTYIAGPTNDAGNFYVTPADWSPTFPLSNVTVGSPTSSNLPVMQSTIGRDGSCATCHARAAGPGSPGPVSLALANGGTPP